MRPYHVVTLALVFLWQIAPFQAVRTPDGELSLSVAGGAGRYEYATFDCSGNLVDAWPNQIQSVGARLDYERGLARLTVATGRATQTLGDQFELSSYAGEGTRPYTAAQVAIEGGAIGLGLGVWLDEPDSPSTTPTAYLRLGSRRGMHWRFDVFEPTATPLLTPVVRTGFEWSRRPGRRVGAYAGLGWHHDAEKFEQFVAFTDLTIGLTDRLDLLVRAFGGPGLEVEQYGIGSGVKIWLR